MPRKLLVVDDIGINREILKKILGDDYEILEAENGAEALEIMQNCYRSLSAVLLDLAMPVMNGFEVLSRMRSNAELSHIPVIVTTGQTEEESEVKALKLGANDYVTKPYNSTIIRQRIWNTINLRETAATVNALQRDKLTGLYNREVFFEKAAEMLLAHAPGFFVMAAFNIDSFKVINDQYGTAMGDAVLRHVGRCIDDFVVQRGGICGRIMADNFAVLYPREIMDSEALLENHRDTTTPACLDRPISIRIGRYIASDLALSANAMYDRASLAEASVRGRYDVYIGLYDESMRTHILHEQQIVNEMNGALSGGQFEVWFQPQFNHATGALIGAEGLVRWRHPDRGLISPADFIPIFERSGFIYSLDKYVWEQVCRYLRKWMAAGRSPLPVSVNISRYDLFRDDLIDVIAALADRYGIPADLLRFEITESAFAESPDQIIDVVEALTDRGFAVEIDDFGSGYSSLNTLKDVPANILKLDMRFLERGRNSARGGNILESVVRMAKWLGMPVIAEGVETIAQADYLKSIGCCYIQGYLYARPMPASDYEAFVERFEREAELPMLETLERLDNNAFWDPQSMETLIFNSFVGGACIFEYQNGRMELLRINDNYVRELGSGDLTAANAHAIDPLAYMDEENRARLMENLNAAIQTGRESSCELLLTGVRGPGTRTYLRSTSRVIATAGTHYLFYCSIFNVTDLREAEQKEREATAQLLTAQSELLDNLPCGAALYRLEGDTLKATRLNKRYCELVGRVIGDPGSVSVTGAVHPDDRAAMRAELQSSIAEGRDLCCELRLRYADTRDVYRAFRAYGRSVANADGTYSIYVIFLLLNGEAAEQA